MKKSLPDYSQKDIFHLSVPVLAVDIVIFTIYAGKLCVVVTRLPDGRFALPGGIVANGEDPEATFDRVLESKASIKGLYKEQLYTFGKPNRDSRGHVVSITYYALADEHAILSNADLTKVSVIALEDLDSTVFAYDHKEIVLYARQRLEWKLEYTNVAGHILPSEFTFSDLQKVYEIIFGRMFDKRNFRKKILSLWIVKETGDTDKSRSKRPAMLYRFTEHELRIMNFL